MSTDTIDGKNVVLEAIVGDNIDDKLRDAAHLANNYPLRVVEMCFNGVTMLFDTSSDITAARRDYDRALRGYLGDTKTIGPVYAKELTAEELASDAAIFAEKQRRYAEDNAKWEESRKVAAELLRGALLVAPALELRDRETWDCIAQTNADSSYGMRTIKYAEDVGRLLQSRHQSRLAEKPVAMAVTIAEDLNEVERMADDDGITGAMRNYAIGLLCKCWQYGDELRAAAK